MLIKGIWEGTFASNPSQPSDLAYVKIPGFGNVRIGPCKWQTRDNITLPHVDDPCVVVQNQDDDWWIVAWWPDSAFMSGPGFPAPEIPDGSITTAKQAPTFKANDAALLDGIDSLGFLKLLVAADKQIAFGTGVSTWNGLGVAAGVSSPSHGLPATPTYVFLQITATSGLSQPPAHRVSVKGATTFSVQMSTIDGSTPLNGSTANYDWMAIT